VLDHIPIRWRLALLSAGLTFVILSAFAIVIGSVTASRVRSNFNNEMAAAVDRLSDSYGFVPGDVAGQFVLDGPDPDVYAASNKAVIRVSQPNGRLLDGTKAAPDFGVRLPRTTRLDGYRVETRNRSAPIRHGKGFLVPIVIQYARKVSDVEATIRGIRFFLGGGVMAGTLLALLGGVLLGRRAMSPIAGLTAVAQEIATTRDPGRSVPKPRAEDEVAQLADTLQAMLDSLEASREETEGALARQRQFVADASHELRTPLTSILANLELLADVLDGERGEAAQSALRSSQRMRRLVGDLLLLARADANRRQPHEPTDVGQVLIEAAAELGPLSADHVLTVDVDRAVVDGARDELHRLALNLMENAVRHTPPGTNVGARASTQDGEVVLVVTDDGPGVAPELRDRIFERFVRGGGDRGSSSGLGLSIVRAVAESHGGTVTFEDARPGARFVVRLPAAEITVQRATPAEPAPA
jgi:two-component system, OmpR family, sensor kinase